MQQNTGHHIVSIVEDAARHAGFCQPQNKKQDQGRNRHPQAKKYERLCVSHAVLGRDEAGAPQRYEQQWRYTYE